MHSACRIFARYTSNQSLVTALPRLGIDLYLEELIKGMILPQGGTLLAEIKKAVCKDYRKLEAFAEVLCKSTTTAEIGYSIKRDYSKYLYQPVTNDYCIGEAYWSDNDKNGKNYFM